MSLIGSIFLFIGGVALLGYIPGALILSIARLDVSRLERFMLSLTLGLVISGVASWLFTYFSVQRYLILYGIAVAGLFIYHSRCNWEWPRIRITGPHLLLVAIIGLNILVLAISPLYYSNLTLAPDGRMHACSVFDPYLHAAIARELTRSVTPQNPVFSGVRLSYHIGADLAAASFANALSLETVDLTVRFLPTLFVLLTTCSIFCFARLWLKSGYGAAFTTGLVIFGEDFSFIPGLLQSSPGDWSVQYFSVPAVFSLFFVNPIQPALALLFAVLFCLAKSFSGDELKWQILAGVLFAGLAECKIFTAAHLGLAIVVAGVLSLLLYRNWGMIRAAAIAGLFSLPILIQMFVANQQGAQQSVTLFRSKLLPHMIDALGLDGQFASLSPAVWCAIAVPMFVVGSMGLRIIGIPGLVRDLIVARRDNAVRVVAASFVLFGAILGTIVTIVPRAVPQDYNNGVWFYADAKYVAWLFALSPIVNFLGSISKRVVLSCLVAIALLTLSIPSTIKHFALMLETAGFLSADTVQVLRVLRSATQPGDTVLTDPQLTGPMIAMTKCHALLGPYSNAMVSFATFHRRAADLNAFVEAWRRGQVESERLERYRVKYVVVDKLRQGSPRLTPGLRLILQDPQWVVYRVEDRRPEK
jgi:hypothetical protein